MILSYSRKQLLEMVYLTQNNKTNNTKKHKINKQTGRR